MLSLRSGVRRLTYQSYDLVLSTKIAGCARFVDLFKSNLAKGFNFITPFRSYEMKAIIWHQDVLQTFQIAALCLSFDMRA